jgi:hypothetical protein
MQVIAEGLALRAAQDCSAPVTTVIVGFTLNKEVSNKTATRQNFVRMTFNFAAKTVASRRARRRTCVRYCSRLPTVCPLTDITTSMNATVVSSFTLPRFSVSTCSTATGGGNGGGGRSLARGALSLRAQVVLPPSAANGFLALLRVAVQNQPTLVLSSIQAESTEVVLRTDATPSGYGGVLLRHGAEPLPFGGRFDTRHTALVRLRQQRSSLLSTPLLRYSPTNRCSFLWTTRQRNSTWTAHCRTDRLAISPCRSFQGATHDLLRSIRARVRVDRIASDHKPAHCRWIFGSPQRFFTTLCPRARGGGYTAGEWADGAARPQR